MGMFDNPGYLSNPDPLGIGKRQQALDRRASMFGKGQMSINGLLNAGQFSPSWDAMLESLNGKRVSYANLPKSDYETRVADPATRGLSLALPGHVQGRPGQVRNAPRNPLGGGYETHEDFMKRYGR
jgi:hypothetical protein